MNYVPKLRGPAGQGPAALPRPEQAYAAIEAAFAQWVAMQVPAFLDALDANPQVRERGGIVDPTVTHRIDPSCIPEEKLALVKRSLQCGILPELSFTLDEAGTLAMVVSGNDQAEFEAEVALDVVVPLPEISFAQMEALRKTFVYQLVSQLNEFAASHADECLDKTGGRVPVAVFINGAAWAMAAWGDEEIVRSGVHISEAVTLARLANGDLAYLLTDVNAPIPKSLLPGLPEGFLPEQPLLIQLLAGGGENSPEDLGKAIVDKLQKHPGIERGLGRLARGFGMAKAGLPEQIQGVIAKLAEDIAFKTGVLRAAGERPTATVDNPRLPGLPRKQSAEDKARLKQQMEGIRNLIRSVNAMAEKPVIKDQMAQTLHVALTLTEMGKASKAAAFLQDHLSDFRGDFLPQEVQALQELLRG